MALLMPLIMVMTVPVSLLTLVTTVCAAAKAGAVSVVQLRVAPPDVADVTSILNGIELGLNKGQLKAGLTGAFVV